MKNIITLYAVEKLNISVSLFFISNFSKAYYKMMQLKTIPRSVRSLQSWNHPCPSSSSSTLSPINFNVAKTHFFFSSTCSFIKWKVFLSDINFMVCTSWLWYWSQLTQCHLINILVKLYVALVHLVVVIRGWAIACRPVAVWWGGGLGFPMLKVKIGFSWWSLDAVHFTPVVAQEMNRGHVVGWGCWSTRQRCYRYRPLVLP